MGNFNGEYQVLNIWLCSSKQLVWRPPLLSGTACSSKLKIEMILMKTLSLPLIKLNILPYINFFSCIILNSWIHGMIHIF